VSRKEQSGRMSLRRPKPPIKGGSAPEEEESFQPHYGPGVDSASNRNEYQ